MAQDDHGQQSHGDSESVPPAPKTTSPPVAGPGADPVAEAAADTGAVATSAATNHTHTPTPTPPTPPPPPPPPPHPPHPHPPHPHPPLSSNTSSPAPAAKCSVSTQDQQLPPPAPIAPVSNPNTPSAPSPTKPPSPASSGASAPAPAGAGAGAACGDSTTPVSAAAPAAETAAVQQNGDDGAHEPENKSESEMSSQHPGASHGLPVSYPASTAPTYSPVAVQYGSYPSVPSSPADPYRPTPVPVGSNAMSLPSMRTIDPVPSQSQTGSPMATPHTMPMNVSMAPLAGGLPLYGHPGMGLPSNYGLPDGIARFAIPHDPRLLGHRGPKKEIKRRTKTGCLTCRKRRIKCDETHPTCNNCKKSKRECLGYDPIFRQQSGLSASTISNIQPAPPASQTPAPPSTLPSSVPSSVTSSAPAIGARPANSYGNQPSMLPSSYATSQTSSSASIPSNSTPPPASFASTSPVVRNEPVYDYQSTSLDPVLHSLPSNAHPAVQDSSRLLDPKKMKIDEIIDLLGPTPPAPQITYNEETFNEIVKVYHEMYAPGLSAFFETGWYYFVENGQMTFPKEPNLMARMASFLKILEGVRANDHSQMASSGILETRIVWELARTTYQTPDTPSTGSPMTLPPDGDTKEAKNRVVVVEALLCGDCLPSNPLSPPYQDVDPHRTRQFDFWYNLAEFVRTRENIFSPETIKARDDILARMRHLLDGRENRDVLYSIAVVRELTPHFDPNHSPNLPQHLDETDPRHRLAVASKFILDESQVTGGTTNVVRRFSDIASRAFVNPGVNIVRRT